MGIAELALFLKLSFVTSSATGFSITPEQFWTGAFGTEKRMPMAGDADGDGRADLLSLWPTGECVIDMAKTSAVGKPIIGNVALGNFGRDGIAAVCGAFVRQAPAADMLEICADGSVRVASGMQPGTNQYQRNDLAAQIPERLMPKLPVKSAVADFDGDGLTDVLFLDSTGNLLYLRNNRTTPDKPRFEATRIISKLPYAIQFSAGTFGNEKKAEVVWLNDKGSLNRALIARDDLNLPVHILDAVSTDRLAVGHFRGEKNSDIVIGQTLLQGGDPKQASKFEGLPDSKTAQEDGLWWVADIDGNGKDDLVRFHRAPVGFNRQDTYVHFSYDSQDKDKGYYCTSNDGLPDCWKSGRIKPAGMDLSALGCKIGHQDVICEIERFENVNEASMRANLQRVSSYFAGLPTKNPDGTTGITIHFIFKPAWLLSRHDEAMNKFDEYFPPRDRKGIVHSMFDENNGPGVAQVCGDNGHWNGDWHVFVHEFGHQLDLSHDGFWPVSNSPLYSSLMNYSYSYSLNDRGDDAAYSDGSRASVVLNELHLSEKLPFPIETVKFLAGGPYRFPIKADPDGKHTLVDWNRNGIFGEEDIAAGIHYSHGGATGPQYDLGAIHTAPCMVNDRSTGHSTPIVVYGQDRRLVARAWLGQDRDKDGQKWTDEQVIDDLELMKDASAVYCDNHGSWVAYPTPNGVALRSIKVGPTNGRITAGATQFVSKSEGAEPTLASFDGHLALILWRSATQSLGLRLIDFGSNGATIMPEVTLDIESQTPVGVVAGSATASEKVLWITRMAPEGRTEAIQLLQDATKGFKISSREIMDGKYAPHRMTLLWEPMAGLGDKGRLYQFTGDVFLSQFITMRTAYPNEGGGWHFRRYGEPDFTSVSAPGVCFFQDNMIYALRTKGDRLIVAFYGSGATPKPLGDFDDISHIRNYGLSRSIRQVSK